LVEQRQSEARLSLAPAGSRSGGFGPPTPPTNGGGGAPPPPGPPPPPLKTK
jgi:hypothetical protein